MAILSVAQYTKNKNIRQSLPFKMDNEGGKYYDKGVWIDKQRLDEIYPIDLPFTENSRKGENPERSKRFIHNERSY